MKRERRSSSGREQKVWRLRKWGHASRIDVGLNMEVIGMEERVWPGSAGAVDVKLRVDGGVVSVVLMFRDAYIPALLTVGVKKGNLSRGFEALVFGFRRFRQ